MKKAALSHRGWRIYEGGGGEFRGWPATSVLNDQQRLAGVKFSGSLSLRETAGAPG
ncbi:MAG: hypothetical protein M1423_03230 [Acidobacteria bacterium]|nr:hypothetical protein [Acidobacteriota bacterium]